MSVQGEEFERAVDIDHLELFDGDVFVVWRWYWVESSDLDDDHSAEDNGDPQDSDNQQDNGSDNEPAGSETDTESGSTAITHSVVFKCVGASRDMNSQVALSFASKNKEAEVRLEYEKDNPKNARAIAFTGGGVFAKLLASGKGLGML